MLTAQELPGTKVGVAPGTTTFTLGDSADCDSGPRAARQRYLMKARSFGKVVADAAASAAAAATPAAPAALKLFSPYATFEDLRGVGFVGLIRRLFSRKPTLGYILSPAGDISPRQYGEVVAVMKNTGPDAYCGTYDRYYHQRATPGFFHDTHLGAIPSDLQLSRIRGYTPVMSSWAPFDNYSWAPLPWIPPAGTRSSGGIRPVGPPISRMQLGDAGVVLPGGVVPTTPTATQPTSTVIAPADPGQEAVDALKRHQDRVFALTVVSTLAVASTAVVNLLKHVGEQREKKRRHSTSSSGSIPNIAPPALSGARRRRGRR